MVLYHACDWQGMAEIGQQSLVMNHRCGTGPTVGFTVRLIVVPAGVLAPTVTVESD